jgi:hypothetical protein
MRKGFNGLSALAEKVLEQDPYSGHLFVFRGRRGDLIKVIWWDGQGACPPRPLEAPVTSMRFSDNFTVSSPVSPERTPKRISPLRIGTYQSLHVI